METLMNEYWWTGSVGSGKGIRWRLWGGLCAPKTVGGMGFRRLHEMNLALLGKQAWRLITNPTSLVTKVYKARYYPHTDFFEAKDGSNPSYICRDLLAGQSTMRDGCRRAIGNGYDTSIGNTPWLPDDDDPYIHTDVPGELANAPVSSLLNIEVF
ncbi:PREDICTED: uncharacterized protein LOC109162718 [Ipomoea nil]|uniref:uncharacterized protein LOC109162718 n=1 Tax=Ipomoea nil TaxID=35883 RepID=UPI000901123F|nr:PREDICTED: uncharacterized protein LOC109162718 [Ipomoea nil]